MVKATTPRKHHYLPQFYLKGFAAKRRIQQIEKSTLNTIGTAIHNVAAIRDYHRLDSDKADDQFELERKLSEIESKLALALDAALKTGIADLQHHARLCELVSLLRMRVPAMKQAIERTSEAFVRSRALIMERQGALPQPPKGLEALLKIDNLRIDISNWVCLQHMFQLAADKDILSILLSMRPVLFSAPPGEEFVTSDQPVALFSPEVRPTDHYGAALAAKSTELSLPLSSDKLLRLSWESNSEEQRVATTEEVREFNRRTITMASQYIFARRVPPKTLELVKLHRANYAGIEPPQVLKSGTGFLHVLKFRPVCKPEFYDKNV